MSLRFWRRKQNEELDDEIESHLQMAVHEHVGRGETFQQAGKSARTELGNIGIVKETTRDVWGWRWITDGLQDVRYGFRTLRKSAGFTAVAVLTLALGIGANAAIFSILDPLLLRKLPVQNPDELVLIHSGGSMETLDNSDGPDFALYRDNNHVFSDVFADAGISSYQITQNGTTSSGNGDAVSGNYFGGLGVRPFAGRLLNASGGHGSAGNPEIVLSFEYWRSAYEGDITAIGKTIPIGNLSYTIVGVTPPEFFGLVVGKTPDFYLPMTKPLKEYFVTIFGRLKPGVSLAQAQTDLEPVFQQVLAQSSVPAIERPGGMARLVLTPAGRGLSDLRTKFSLPARILMAVVGLILLIACSNVANLLFARGAARRKEITLRLALGAGRWRLVRQLITESALLALMGAAVGLLLANWGSNLLVAALSTEHFHVALKAGLSGRVLLFTAGILVLTALLCGLTPALSATRAGLAQDLKLQGSGASTSASGRRGGMLVVVGQVALSMTILAGAGLLLHSLFNLETFDLGFNRDNVLAINFNGSGPGRTPEQINTFYDQLIERTKSIPGVRSASISAYTQTSGLMGLNVEVEGHPVSSAEESHVFFNMVAPDYFETLGIPVLQGREFTNQDGGNAAMVAIINRTMARHYFGDESPIGRRLNFDTGKKWPAMEIVGVVADSKYNDLREASTDFVYVNRTQMRTLYPAPNVAGVLDVRATGNAKALSGPLREAIHSLDSSVKITGIKTLRQQIDESLHQDRLIATLCGIFSLLALTLTCVGLYGTLSFSVVRRTNEIGVRMALGARPANIFALVIGQGIRLVIVGLVIGAVGALASASLLAKLLFGVKGADPVTFVGVSVVLIVAAILACYLPARRAMRVDPMVALRYE
jgi:predicted permease